MARNATPAPSVEVATPSPALTEPDIEGLFLDQPLIRLAQVEFYLSVPGQAILAAARAGLVTCRGQHLHADIVEVERGSLIAWLRISTTPYSPAAEVAAIAQAKRQLAAETARHKQAVLDLERRLSQANCAIVNRREAEFKAAWAERNRQRQREFDTKGAAIRCY